MTACHIWRGPISPKCKWGERAKYRKPQASSFILVIENREAVKSCKRNCAAFSPGVQASRKPPAQSGFVGSKPYKFKSSLLAKSFSMGSWGTALADQALRLRAVLPERCEHPVWFTFLTRNLPWFPKQTSIKAADLSPYP